MQAQAVPVAANAALFALRPRRRRTRPCGSPRSKSFQHAVCAARNFALLAPPKKPPRRRAPFAAAHPWHRSRPLCPCAVGRLRSRRRRAGSVTPCCLRQLVYFAKAAPPGPPAAAAPVVVVAVVVDEVDKAEGLLPPPQAASPTAVRTSSAARAERSARGRESTRGAWEIETAASPQQTSRPCGEPETAMWVRCGRKGAGQAAATQVRGRARPSRRRRTPRRGARRRRRRSGRCRGRARPGRRAPRPRSRPARGRAAWPVPSAAIERARRAGLARADEDVAPPGWRRARSSGSRAPRRGR